MKKVVITFIIALVVSATFFVIDSFNQNDYFGEVTVQVVDENGDFLIEDQIGFLQEDTLFDLLDENYELGCANASYQLSTTCEEGVLHSRVLLKIGDLETDWRTTYIGIYVNDEYSNYGIDDIPLKDGDIYRFEYTLVGGDVN